MGYLLRILLLILIAWYIYRFLDKYVAPLLFGKPKETPPGRNENKFRKSTRQGGVTITDYGEQKKNVDPPKDDYIDYEELD